jgi:hypothetical protein
LYTLVGFVFATFGGFEFGQHLANAAVLRGSLVSGVIVGFGFGFGWHGVFPYGYGYTVAGCSPQRLKIGFRLAYIKNRLFRL